MKKFIRTMAPGWFASVMGTSVTSLAAWFIFKGTAFAWVSDVLHYLACAMMLVLGVFALLRIFLYPRQVFETISHPVEGSFYATFPIALLVMAGQWSARGIDPFWVGTLWWVGVAGTFLCSYIVLFRLFTLDKLRLEMVTPAHFIPAVGLVVIPVAGASLAGQAVGAMRELYFGINMLGMGAGVFMYIALVAIVMGRHFLAPAIEGKMTPTLWVHLAPLGVIPLSMLSLLHAVGNEGALAYGLLVAMGFMGASLWWLVLALAMTVRNALLGKLPFALSWWAFVFPIGAITVLAIRLSSLANLTILPFAADGLMTLLLLVWLAAAVGTVRGLANGSILNPPKPAGKPGQAQAAAPAQVQAGTQASVQAAKS